MPNSSLETNWTEYYKNPSSVTVVTRGLTQKLLADMFKRGTTILNKEQLSVCELGGANSCFVDGLIDSNMCSQYDVVDKNEFGLQLFREKNFKNGVSAQAIEQDLIQPLTADIQKNYDLCFSVGLIEHFNPQGTKEIIKKHFDLVTEGGLVLISFPTPTLQYRLTRKLMEKAGVWGFPDERPLEMLEVEDDCLSYGRKLDSFIFRMLPLTQGFVLAQKLSL